MEPLKNGVVNIVHEGKQVPENEVAIILTVKRIGRTSAAGALDFGGSEYKQADVEWFEPQKKQEDDKYGWWNLTSGDYVVEYNESVHPAEGQRFHFQIWPPALYNGVTHPSEVIASSRDPLRSSIRVGAAGADIKENARVSVVTPLG
ncbi:MAG: hypothetical protein ACLFPV_06980 [Spirochaetaceae bacterium]